MEVGTYVRTCVCVCVFGRERKRERERERISLINKSDEEEGFLGELLNLDIL